MVRSCWIIITLFIGSSSFSQSLQKSHDNIINLGWDELNTYFESLESSTSSESYMDMLKSILDYGETSGNRHLQTVAYYFIGKNFYNENEWAKASNFFSKGIEMAMGSNDHMLKAELHMALGSVSSRLFRKEEQLKNYLQAYEAYAKINQYKAASTQFSIANIYFTIGEYKECIEHGLKAKTLLERFPYDSLSPEDKNIYIRLFNTIGIGYREQSVYDSAIWYLKKSSQIAAKENNKFWENLPLGNLGSLYVDRGEYERALPLLLQDFKTSLEFQQFRSAANAGLKIGETYLLKRDLATARQYYDTVCQIIENRNLPDSKMKYLKNMHNWYEAQHDIESAHRLYKRYIELRDSIKEGENKVEISRIKAAYDFDNQMAQIELLTKSNLLQEEALEKQTIITVSVILLLLLIISMALYMFHNLRVKKKDNQLLQMQRDQISAQSKLLSAKNQTIESINANLEMEVEKRTRKLKQVNKELDTFLYRASHDIRQPIATMLGLEQLARKISKDENITMILDKINTTASGMDLMLSKLQMLYQLNHGKEVLKDANILEITNKILKQYQDSIVRKKIIIINEVEDITYHTNPDLLAIIIRNIIENAICFNRIDDESYIKIYSQHNKTRLTLSIEDNGMGIESYMLEQIFNAYFKGSERSTGNGLGLFLSKKAADLLNIHLTVESQWNRGSKFSLHIPVPISQKDTVDSFTKKESQVI